MTEPTADETAWVEMWDRKNSGQEMFCQAELLEDKELQIWNGHGKDPEFTPYMMKAGQIVLITVASRFGHVGIRGKDIDKETHGYHGCVMPEKLKNLKFLSDGGVGWRQALDAARDAARKAREGAQTLLQAPESAVLQMPPGGINVLTGEGAAGKIWKAKSRPGKNRSKRGRS